MHAFLVSAPPNLGVSPDILCLYPEKTLGIDEIRQIRHFLGKKPITLPANTVVIHQAEKLTLPAQHALLKILEEPPGNSLIYLVTAQPDQLLPTILSRVLCLDTSAQRPVDIKTDPISEQLLEKLLSTGSVGERLSIIESADFSRNSALEFLAHSENFLHLYLQKPAPPKDLQRLYLLLHRTRTYLKANVNVKLAMDHFAIDLPSLPIEPAP